MTLPLFEQLSLFRFGAPPDDPARPRPIQIGSRIVTYQLTRRRRRSIGMTIDERGLIVGAPKQAAIKEIENFIHSNGAWVIQKLEEFAGSNTRRHLAVRHGSRLPLLGAEVEVRIVAGANRVHWDEQTLVIAARPDADVDALARRAFKQRALALFGERLQAFAARGGHAAPPPLALSSARTRWGSCSEKTGIRLNWRLIHLPLALIDYVVAHELAHLREMNHSPRFWAEVATLFPDWRNARRELKAQAGNLPIL
jgi:predicted metal-dependent hydrolase